MKVERACECCRKSFTARSADVARGWARFCSKRCKAIKQDERAPRGLGLYPVADRPVAEISELSGAKLIVLYSVDEIGHLPKGTKLYTHPSGHEQMDTEKLRELDQKMTDYLDQEVEPDFDVIEKWRDDVRKLAALLADANGEG